MVAASAVVSEDKIVNIISIFSGHRGRTDGKGCRNSLCQSEQSPCGYFHSLTLCSVLSAWSSAVSKETGCKELEGVKVSISAPLSCIVAEKGRKRAGMEWRKMKGGGRISNKG